MNPVSLFGIQDFFVWNRTMNSVIVVVESELWKVNCEL